MRAWQIFSSSLLKCSAAFLASLAMAEESQQLLEDLSKYLSTSTNYMDSLHLHLVWWQNWQCLVIKWMVTNAQLPVHYCSAKALLVERIDVYSARWDKHMEPMLAAGVLVWLGHLGPRGDRLVGKFVPQHRVNQNRDLDWFGKKNGKETELDCLRPSLWFVLRTACTYGKWSNLPNFYHGWTKHC